MFLKRLFYASATILVLVLTYHFGATNAQGQSGSYFQVLPGQGYVRVGEALYTTNGSSQWRLVDAERVPPVPTHSLVFITEYLAITDFGEGWVRNGGSGPWVGLGLVPGGPIPIQQQTWGSLKAKFKK